jgi:hypothetical protein
MTNQASPAVLPSLRQPLSSRRASDLVLTGYPEITRQGGVMSEWRPTGRNDGLGDVSLQRVT